MYLHFNFYDIFTIISIFIGFMYYIDESYAYCFSIFSLFDYAYATYILQYILKLNEIYN